MNDRTTIETWDSDLAVEQFLIDCDEKVMPLPGIEFEPHLLISKVRKHYMEYIIKLLSVNYENNQRLLNKNIYLPSAIWRCAKNIEMAAAQASMMVHIYRKNIVTVIKELQNDTKRGKLYKKLYECLHRAPENEKKLQTTLSSECDCQCYCKQRKKRRKISDMSETNNNGNESEVPHINQFKTLTSINPQLECSKIAPDSKEANHSTDNLLQKLSIPNHVKEPNSFSPKPCIKISTDTQDSDELMLQLEKLFQGDSNDDDLFEGTLYDSMDANMNDDNTKKISETDVKKDPVIENHAAQIKSLDERLASLAGLLLVNNNNDDDNSNNLQPKSEDNSRHKKHNSNKWLCEEYFLKLRLLELLDQIRETNRKKFTRIKGILLDLFGDDSDDEEVASPLDETPEFVISCKERIAPWVVKLLTPYYVKGRIRGKALFKALAKHLIKLIYQCSRYPQEYEVHSFVSDFLQNHKMIRCEADFKQFRIENI